MPKVSVIVPIYNVEPYIERCARSLFEQTIDDIEYIFVDDATPDHSIDILYTVIDIYPHRKKQCSILHHKTNKGLPQARKTGVFAATGDFIIHCDSDDWVDSMLYEKMYTEAKKSNADIVVCDFITHTHHGEIIRKGTRTSNMHIFNIDLLAKRSPVSMFNKMIRRDIYTSDIIFPEQNMGEDMATILQLIRSCTKIGYINDIYYHYDGTTPSITREETKTATVKRAIQSCINAEIAIRCYKDDNSKEVANGIILLKYMQRRLFMPAINHRDVHKLWRNTFPEINKDILFNWSIKIPLIERVKFLLTLIYIFPIIKNYTRKNLK